MQTFPGKKALVLEPNERGCELLSLMLEKMAVENVTFYGRLHVVPDLDGYDLLVIDESIILQSPEVQELKLPVVVMHNISSTSALQAGYQYPIRKPIRPSDFHQTVASALKGEMRNAEHARPKEIDTLPLEGKTFLLAEDNIVNQKVAVQMLKKIGVRMDVVGNGKEAVEMVSQRGYDYVFMDVQMPELDGLEATQLIRRLDKGGSAALYYCDDGKRHERRQRKVS
jgi:CheY-like chemotaxis protein